MTTITTTAENIAFKLRRKEICKKYYEKRKELGLCMRCRKSVNGKTLCAECMKENCKTAKLNKDKRRGFKCEWKCVVCAVGLTNHRVLCDEHKIRTCQNCGCEFNVPSRGKLAINAKFCSCKCRGEAHTGPNAPRWTGGVRCRSRTRVEAQEHDKWRRAVKKRDNFTCQDCGIKGVRMHAHHIKEYAKYPESRFEVSNGLTLCRPCHSERHGREIPDFPQPRRHYVRVS